MVQQRKQPNTKILAWVCGIYLVPVIAAVLYAWIWEGYPLDFSLTVSIYVARNPWTAVLFFIHIAAVCMLLLQYIRTLKIRRIQKLIYCLVLLCIFGCGIFPCNRSRSVLAADIHDFFSYALVILVSLTFAGMLVFARQTGQRVFAVGSLIFTVAFIVVFALKIPAVKGTIFIWENVVMLLLLMELFFEKYNADACRSANHPSP